MRHEAGIKPGSSVVISVPDSVSQRTRSPNATSADTLGFRTDGYFNTLEQYVERALLSAGLQAKERAKFEAKLRDIRDSGAAVRSADPTFAAAMANLSKDLDANLITVDKFAEKGKQLREKLLEPTGGSTERKELTDISELIRAAQDGDVMADYILQVNDLSVTPYDGSSVPDSMPCGRPHPSLGNVLLDRARPPISQVGWVAQSLREKSRIIPEETGRRRIFAPPPRVDHIIGLDSTAGRTCRWPSHR